MVNIFRVPSVEVLAKRQLDESERELLKCEAELENHQSHKALLVQRIYRLKTMLAVKSIKIEVES